MAQLHGLLVLPILLHLTSSSSQCRTSDLLPGVRITGPCPFLQGSVCQATCTHGNNTWWQMRVWCLKDGRWSRTPHCKDISSVHKSLERVDCDRLPVKGKPLICLNIKQTITRKVLCQPLLSLKLDLGHCSRLPGSSCKVSCGDGEKETMRCLADGRWSHIPKCGALRQKFCSKPEVGSLDENCTRNEEEWCQLHCPHADKKIRVKCVRGTHWSPHLTCSCPKPSLREDLKFQHGDCSSKKVGEDCKLKCRDNASTASHDSIDCTKKGTWSSQPSCLKGQCPELKLPPHLMMTRGACQTRTVGSICQVSCKESEQSVVGQDGVICLNTLRWSPFPLCTCPEPDLRGNEGLRASTKGNLCRKTPPGDTCYLECGEGRLRMRGDPIIRCLDNTTWSTPLPKCVPKPCPVLRLPKYLEKVKTCSEKIVGDTCEVTCKEGGGKLVGSRILVCLNETSWSETPACTCPRPVMRGGLSSTMDCGSVLPGGRCQLRCEGQHTEMIGKDYILCGNDSRWSSHPTCTSKKCFVPRLPKYLVKLKTCSEKNVGDTCEVTCKERGVKLVGSKTLVCLNETSWSEVPTCTCPRPVMRGGLSSSMDCDSVLPGGRCQLRCEGENTEMTGQDYILCGNDSRWNAHPICTPKKCPEPRLPKYLEKMKTCSEKNVGDTCEVTCKERGVKLVGSKTLVCLNETSWSEVPTCTCPRPVMMGGLSSTMDCDSVLPGGRCQLRCEGEHTEMTGRDYIVCGNNSRWSDHPICTPKKCTEPELRSTTLKIEDMNCTSKSPGATCRLACRSSQAELVGMNLITCMATLKWTEFPTCACPSPDLGTDLKTAGECEKKLPGQTCRLACKDPRKALTSSQPTILCNNETQWSKLPGCKENFCTKPTSLKSNVILEPGCSRKIPGENCSVSCDHGGQVLGDPWIRCIENTKWSMSPTCGCPPPRLGESLEGRRCKKMSPGNRCILRCKPGKKMVGNQSSIICRNDLKWTQQPRCVDPMCAKPKLTAGLLETVGDCTDKNVGDTCKLRCVAGGKVVGGLDAIKCLNETNWSMLPDCACPAPVLRASLDTTADCNQVRRGGTCKLFCRENKKMTGNETIICLGNAEWSSQPTCEELLCPEPRLPRYLRTMKSCTSKTAGEDCELTCSQGGSLIGEKNVVCLTNQTWTPAPKCTCVPLEPGQTFLKIENCTSVKPGESCFVSCMDQFSRPDREVMLCDGSSSRWADKPPVCSKTRCQSITFSRPSVYRGTCENKIAGDSCSLRCIGDGVFLGNDNHIRCNKDGQWSRPRNCVCSPPPEISDYIRGKCTDKRVNDTCPIACRNGFDARTQKFITCSSFYRWENYPPCEPESCPSPVLQPHLKVVEGNCDRMRSRSSCRLECEKGVMQGSPVLYCDEFLKVSLVPRCVCPPPVFPEGIISNDGKCDTKRAGQLCRFHCSWIPSRVMGVKCKDDLSWVDFGKCPCTSPTIMNENVFMVGPCAASKIFPVDTRCDVTCPNPAWMSGANVMVCMSQNEWSASPICVCPPPDPPSVFNMSNCKGVLAGGVCEVGCPQGLTQIARLNAVCNPNYTWKLPEMSEMCATSTCSDMRSDLYKHFVEVLGHCAKKSATELVVGITCPVRCFNGAELITAQFIRCQQNMTWDVFPQCPCPPLHVPFPYHMTEDCNRIFDTQICRLSIIDPTFIPQPGVNFVASCINKGQWAPLPPIIARDNSPWCTPPHEVDPLLAVPDQCKRMRPGDSCEVWCVGGGNFINALPVKVTVSCVQPFGQPPSWTPLPQCACKRTIVMNTHVCENIPIRSFCKVPCDGGQGNKYMMCLPNGELSNPSCLRK